MITEKLSENEKLVDVINSMHRGAWPIFLNEDAVVKKYWRTIYSKYPEFQLLFKIDSDYVGIGNSAPIYWNGKIEGLPNGFDDALKTIVGKNENPNTLCGMAAVISRDHLGKGISYKIIEGFKELGKKCGYSNLILPIRPILKPEYPTIAFENFINWKKNDLPFDPWLRVHIKLGGKMLKVVNSSMVIKGTVSDWERWTSMYFGETNKYIVE
ncbi:hypothetical protein J7L48_02820, partial [bacterium]|nr:hypothetical protein [bacterium]